MVWKGRASRTCRTISSGSVSALGGITKTCALRVNLPSQIFPDVVGHGEKCFYDIRIKLPSSPFYDFNFGGLHGLCSAIWAVRGDGVQGIGDRENSRPERNFLTFQAARIT